MGKIKRVLFLGSKEIGLKSLSTLYSIEKETIIGIVTVNDSADERSVLNKFFEFSRLTNIPLEIAKDRENADSLVRKYNPELCIVVGWYWLIKREVLDSVPYGFMGIHNSLLPKYRGGSPLVWAIINGEQKVGFSLFSFSEGIDDGLIWGQKTIDVSNNQYIGEILTKLENGIIEFLKEIYPLILNDSIKPVPQKENDATYCSQRVPEDGKIDWLRSSFDILNFIRAQSRPYPGAFTYWADNKVTIWKASMVNCVFYGTPGQIARISTNGTYVICGDKRPLLLEEVQMGDEKPVKSNEAFRSIKIRFK